MYWSRYLKINIEYLRKMNASRKKGRKGWGRKGERKAGKKCRKEILKSHVITEIRIKCGPIRTYYAVLLHSRVNIDDNKVYFFKKTRRNNFKHFHHKLMLNIWEDRYFYLWLDLMQYIKISLVPLICIILCQLKFLN